MTSVMRFKHGLECPRPMEYTPTVQPMILTPGYTVFPSGHATEAYFVAELLPVLAGAGLPSNKQSMRAQLHRMAFRIAENRVVAGLHFPIDGLAGQLLGISLARYFMWCCGKSAGKPVGGFFTGGSGDERSNFVPELDREPEEHRERIVRGPQTSLPTPSPERKALTALWTAAELEW